MAQFSHACKMVLLAETRARRALGSDCGMPRRAASPKHDRTLPHASIAVAGFLALPWRADALSPTWVRPPRPAWPRRAVPRRKLLGGVDNLFLETATAAPNVAIFYPGGSAVTVAIVTTR